MTTLRQAAQQALEALETLSKLGNGNSDGNSIGNTIAQDARTALRKTLAQEHAMQELSRLGQEIEQEPTPWRDMVVVSLVRENINKHRARELADHFAAQPESCQTCVEIHSLLDADESMIIKNARDGYPEGRTPREFSLPERVKALCKYAADWKRWCIEAQTPPAAQPEQEPWRESASNYKRGVIDGRQMQAQSSVDKAFNAITQRKWVGLEIEEVQDSYNADYQAQTRAIEAKLKQKNI
jgi:hypothetical protein